MRDLKQIGFVTLVAIISFGLGWWTNDKCNFTNCLRPDAMRLDSLEMNDLFFSDGDCNEKLTDLIFFSPDNVTGGFSSTTLQLLQTGQLYLIDSSVILIHENNTGGVYSWTTDTTAIGMWCLRHDYVYLKIPKHDNFLEQTFLTELNRNNGLTIIGSQPILVFSIKLDTLYINKTPCIKLRNEQTQLSL
ncbi:MAG: hypothetical protein IH597_11455 [Bacteroidales bacterium]|nr:hypothetical protein [Bacteroidales bacterium]